MTVVNFRLPVSAPRRTPEETLTKALGEGFTEVLIAGYDAEGQLCIRSSAMTRAEAVYLLTKAQYWATHGDD